MKLFCGFLAAAALSCLVGCGGGDGDEADNGADPNAAVAATHWGAERVVYASDVGWDGDEQVPEGERWDSPPTDQVCARFTYCGPKLVRLEGLDPDGEPWHISKLGVREEWTYAAHGGVVERVAYEADGELTFREKYAYNDEGRCVSRTSWAFGQKLNRSTYTYSADGLTRTDRMEVYGSDGAVDTVHTTKERWDPGEKTWEQIAP
jgi:hypothetical protein